MKNNFYTFILLLSALNAKAQFTPKQEVQIDSLKQVVASAKHDTTIIKAWIAWDNIIYVVDPELDFELNQKIDSLCTVNLNEPLNEKEKYSFLKSKGFALNSFGIIYKNQGDYTKAIDYYTQSLNIRKQMEDQHGIASSLNNIGIIYDNQGNYAKAIDYYTQSLKIREENGFEEGVADNLNNIGNIYIYQGNYDKAAEYYTQSLKIQEKLGNNQGIANVFNNMGVINNHKGNYAKAIDYFTKSLKIREELGYKQGIANSLNSIGDSYARQGEYSQAIEYYTNAWKTYESVKDKKGSAMTLVNIGSASSAQGNYEEALESSSRGLAIAQEVGAAIQTKNAAKSLWLVNRALGKHEQALDMYELYISTRDSLESEANQKAIIRQEYKYQYQKQAAADSVKAAEAAKLKDLQLASQKAENKQQRQQKYFLYGGLSLSVVFGLIVFNRFRVSRKQNKIIEIQKETSEMQRKVVETKNKEITDSINYAKRIQEAILPPKETLKENLVDGFVLFKPKDVVSGDFYWLEKTKGRIFFAAADCTGHGVPGAMVSVVCSNALSKCVLEEGITNTGKLLDRTREIVIDQLNKSGETVNDGMDISLVSIKQEDRNAEQAEIQWSGANNAIWIIREKTGELISIKPDKQPVGIHGLEKEFTSHTIKINKGDLIYLFSDGFADQFGGEHLDSIPRGGKKYKSKRFREFLLSIKDEDMDVQRELLNKEYEFWRGDLEQIDDVCVIGVRF